MSGSSTIILYCKKSKADASEFDQFNHPGFSVLAYGRIASEWFFIMGTWIDSHVRKSGIIENEAALTELFARLVSQQRLLDLLNAWSKFTRDNEADACDPHDQKSTLARVIAGLYLDFLEAKQRGQLRVVDDHDNLVVITRTGNEQELNDIKVMSRRITPRK
jgi:hypothetical protein